ncbi:MAG: hypothetical protein A2725_04295 [Candidatus Magasanikbacteria bacterium RIFCSPHIGHO2_01_FULL_33_34]|uniref:Peptidase S1 domain-containing protein n=1 Tax=Candidatus Magasanikbacteria bacterium RIFCSPHIGHO2_01_FULL_33_34 TaxID=1798671 RepID=A0A1F6LHM4_9BACT|nr:MAG: hypothetical protein A2725_04295 [Candidatus Magasanikbacteria bacterium RIFCSPHIGHO2_01_FULL_33_34]OGH65185.1 MAG: hypothetical protein A3B83_04055 [Candidatus Magasanikbacteria bacterium RIFCSPHIGHO2_02_FULL_33_17]OGH75270.1 MAG: hypothetical protein A3A89_04110 [Candidatus Magasanikbacteria bacterium RIFCSPLOWO2_01_FULL_33_34]
MKKTKIYLLFILTWLLIVIVYILLPVQTIKKEDFNLYYSEVNTQRVISSTAQVTIFNNEKIYLCTAFAYKREGNLYYFATAAHCVADMDDENKNIIKRYDNVMLQISDDLNNSEKDSYIAEVVGVGYEPVGDDFAILTATIDKYIPLLDFSGIEPMLGNCVLNVSFPAKSDGNIFMGYITNINYQIDIESKSIIYHTVVAKLFGIEIAGGASGSALVSCSSAKVYGVVVASTGNEVSLVAIPVQKFIDFEQKIIKKEYLYKLMPKEPGFCPIDEK